MQYTLLQMVQDILSSMDSDEINSVDDTTESQQVVTCIKTVYNDLISRMELPVQYQLFNLTASGDAAKPVLMTRPTTFDHMKWLKYDCQLVDALDPVWREVTYLCLEEFLEQVYLLHPSDTTVASMSHTVNGMTFNFFYRNDTAPKYYTTFNDNTLIFDAYDSAVDSTLQASKSLAYGQYVQTFTETDTFVPNLRPNEFSVLFQKAKSLAWAELKQMPHPIAEKEGRRQEIHLQRVKRAIPVDQSHPGPNYGRK